MDQFARELADNVYAEENLVGHSEHELH
jgi:hypothetical protein